MHTLLRVWLALMLGFLPTVALGAPVPNAPIYPQTPKRYMQRFVTADAAGTYKVVVTGNNTVATNQAGTRCHALYVTSSDTVPHAVTFRLNSTALGANPFPGPIIMTIAATASTQLPVNVFTSTVWPGLAPSSDGGFQLILEPNQTLEATYATAITAATIIGIHAECWDY